MDLALQSILIRTFVCVGAKAYDLDRGTASWGQESIFRSLMSTVPRGVVRVYARLRVSFALCDGGKGGRFCEFGRTREVGFLCRRPSRRYAGEQKTATIP